MRYRLAMITALLGLTVVACQGGNVAETTTTEDTSPGTTVATSQPSTTTSEPATTTTAVDMGPLTLLTESPVVEPYNDAKYVNPGWTIFHEGVWYMFRNSFSAWPGASNVTLMTSEDGLAWTSVVDEPVFTSDRVEFTDGNVFFMSGYVADDGTWVAYFYTYDGSLDEGFIGRATAPAPEGPWEHDPDPVLSPGDQADWDGRRVIEPSVLQTTDGYMMWFTGFSTEGTGRIGLATSDDGIVWSKHDDPATTDPQFANSDPVYVADQDWANGEVDCPEVTEYEGGFLMHMGSPTRSTFASGLATSPDGVNWTSWEGNPLMTMSRTPGRNQFWQSDLQHVDGNLWFFLEVGPGATHTDVYAYRIDLPS